MAQTATVTIAPQNYHRSGESHGSRGVLGCPVAPRARVTTESGSPPPSALSLVLRSPTHRSALLSLYLGGLGISCALPVLSLFLVQDLGASLSVAGLFFLTNLASPLIGVVVGAWSERTVDRLTLYRVGAVVGCAGWLAMAFTSNVTVVFVLNTTALGFSAAAGSLIFAAVRDQLSRETTGADNRVMATVRLGFSAGFMTGPVLGSVLGDLYGLRVVLVAAGVFTLLQLVPVARLVARRDSPTGYTARADVEPAAGRGRSGLRPLLTFLALGVLAMSGDTIRLAYLPLYMELQLGTPDWLRGVVISVQSVGMLIFIPVMGALADRFGAQRLVVANVVLGVLANVGFAVATHEAVLVGATLLNAAMWATLGGIGISVAHELHPDGVGLASSLYFSAMRFAAAIGGMAGALGVGWFGVPGVFVVPAALCVVSALGLALQAVLAHRRSP